MKKVISLLVVFFVATIANAQYAPIPAQHSSAKSKGTTALSIMGGYVFRDQVSLIDYYGYINDGGLFGASLEYFVRPTKSVELSYTRMDTHAPLYLYSGVGGQLNEGKDAISINYILVGGTNYVPVHSSVATPYGGLGIGVGIVDNKDASGSSLTKFAWNVKLGVKLKASHALGVKLQTQLYSVTQGAGGGLYVGSGGGGVGVSTYSSIYQFGFSGGLVFDF